MWLAALMLAVNPLLTPGAVRALTTAQVCSITWGTDSRHVSSSLRSQVFAAYGIAQADRHLYVIDHLIPRELGGSDARTNLWPQRYPAAHVKDLAENKAHRDVCASRLTLEAAQEQMRRWTKE